MPFSDNVYYPFDPNPTEESPVLLNPPWMTRPTMPTSTPSSSHGTQFKFRARHESVDWRSIAAIDVDRLANELDFTTLQENIMGITFCNIEHEKCPRCHNSLDPVLVKLFRLAQFTIEYLLHSQEYLTSHVQTLEEKMHATLCEAEQIKCKVVKQSEEMKSLKEECKRRKKIIATQQMLVTAGAASYHKCQYCEKAFMNYSYLQDHIKRRHNEGKQNLQSSDKLLYEINCLKEELQMAKTQLEAAHTAHIEKLSQIQEIEQKKIVEQELFNKFDSWKKEETKKFEEELQKVKDMFMNEMKELTAKNSWLDQELHEMKKDGLHARSGLGTLQESPSDSDKDKSRLTHDIQYMRELLEKQDRKLEKRMHQLQQEHEREKNLLLLKTERLKLSLNEDQRTKEDVYKKKMDEIGHRLKEQERLIKRQKEQIKELSVKSTQVAKKYPVPTPIPKIQHVETKLSTSREQTHILQPIQELAEDKDVDTEEAVSISKLHSRNALRKDSSLYKELRKVWEEGLMDKIETFGVKLGMRGIATDHFNRAMAALESDRKEKEKCMPEFRKTRENLLRQVNLKVEERTAADAGKSCTLGSTSSAPLRRQTTHRTSTLKSSQEKVQGEPRYPIPMAGSTPKVKLPSSNETHVTKPSSNTTPPFSSDEESDVPDVPLQSNRCTDPVKSKCAVSGKSFVGFATDESDSDGSVLEEIKVPSRHKRYSEVHAPAKPVRAPLIKERTEQLEMARSSHSADHKPVGGIDVVYAFTKNDLDKELKITDLDDTDFDSSSLEKELFEVPSSGKRLESTAQKRKEFCAAPVKNPFSTTKLTKGDAREADTSSTLVSSLVTVSDFSDTSDI
ncbi:cilium assembly protein DZIP1 isoform X2 [Pseudophryne corroboree]|uniref:cilium assembly protein DZIP1 isoform X2 n=1 Tax=Pseudophryne corroboree TaxID=495146 RepID=UPI003081482C